MVEIFLKAFEDTDDVIIPVDSDIIEWMVDGFKDWHKVDLVIHQGSHFIHSGKKTLTRFIITTYI